MLNNKKSPERLAVEAAMQTTTPEFPLTPLEIAELTNLHVTVVRAQLANLRSLDKVYSTQPGKLNGGYVWGCKPAEPKENVPTPRVRIGDGIYDGAELRRIPVRPGAMDAYSLPSLQSERSVERRRPMLMGSSVSGILPRTLG
jgi:hypothetical protein